VPEREDRDRRCYVAPVPRFRCLAGALAIALLAAASVLLGPAVGASTPSPAALLVYAVASTEHEYSVHYVSRSVSGDESTTLVGDTSSLGVGRQDVTLRDGRSTGQVQVRLVANEVYFRGDQFGLATYLGMPSPLARRYAQRWIAFSSSDTGYTQISEALTLSTVISEIGLAGPLTMAASTRIGGVRVLGVHGTWHSVENAGYSGPATLYLTTQSSHLPVLLQLEGDINPRGGTGQVAFSHWNEGFKIAAPKGAVAYSSIVTP
jgi:hypothetical protein